MLADLIEKLIERCIQLAKHSQQRNRAFFDDYVTPAFKQFEVVHREYMACFQKYRDTLRDGDTFINARSDIRWQAQQLILYRGDLRSKSLQMAISARSRDDGRSASVRRTLQEFVNDMIEYLIVNNFNVGGAGPDAGYNNQRWASAVIAALDRVARTAEMTDDEKRYCGIAHVDSAVAEMQFMYTKVSASFFTLKAELVK